MLVGKNQSVQNQMQLAVRNSHKTLCFAVEDILADKSR